MSKARQYDGLLELLIETQMAVQAELEKAEPAYSEILHHYEGLDHQTRLRNEITRPSA